MVPLPEQPTHSRRCSAGLRLRNMSERWLGRAVRDDDETVFSLLACKTFCACGSEEGKLFTFFRGAGFRGF